MTGSHNPRSSRQQQVRKLRESCTSCAHSKIRCTKEKPICARCAERDLPCHYTESKRMGRNPRLPSPNTIGTIGFNQRYGHHGSHNKKPNSAGYVRKYPSQHERPHSQLHTHSGSESVPSSISLEAGEILTNNFTTAMAVSSDTQAVATNVWSDFCPGLSTEMGISSPQIGSYDDFDEFFRHFPRYQTSLPGTGLPSTPINLQLTPSFNQWGFLDPPRCCCLGVALQTLTTLLSDASDGCCRLSEARDCGGMSTFMPTPPIDKLIAGNRRAMEIVQETLACACSQDEYIVSIITLISCKVLSWYSAAGAATLYEHKITFSNESALHLPTGVGLYYLSGEDQRCIVAQLILSELHRAQAVIDRLVTRLAELQGGSQGLSGMTRLGEDLRQRVWAVSSQLIDILQR
ncbi:aflatoxin biosynthesis regulatory protein [Penicillium taxi]|uniref:aflatoxin biosynthesis regulatory protein n=1 Tax=Penicillium taxi TaxID=168475 RepID=UPI00254567DF|nr:aflatoxin biosynthesis regulatory protein [Penicillium taxi]KAJ5888712.1 aflatoxin biosynthesis regulatory protein [Penicillium taxi]